MINFFIITKSKLKLVMRSKMQIAIEKYKNLKKKDVTGTEAKKMSDKCTIFIPVL